MKRILHGIYCDLVQRGPQKAHSRTTGTGKARYEYTQNGQINIWTTSEQRKKVCSRAAETTTTGEYKG